MKLQFLVLSLVFTFFCTSSFAQPNFEQVGFSTQNGGTSGGEGGTTVTVSSLSDLKNYAESDDKYIIRVEGTISNGSSGSKISVGSNTSIIGVGGNAFLQGVGLEIKNNSNIIIQNLKMTFIGLSNPSGVNQGDLISIHTSGKNIWIDHCEFYNENPDVQTDKDKYDGLLDIKGQTGYITISWCYFHDHWKCGLVGAADDDLYNERLVTFHHNYYKNIKYRMPMYRGATGHFFNNYLTDVQDASEIRIGTCVRIERNYYEDFHYAIYTPNDAKGYTERINNYLSGSQSRAFPGSCTANIPYSYSAVLTNNAQDVKSVVKEYSGVGATGEDCNGVNLGGAYVDECNVCVGGNTGEIACILDCNGDENGAASIDQCGVCTGGNTGNIACTGVLQAENACSADGTVDTDNAGFQGEGFLNLVNANGSTASWNVFVDNAKSTVVGIRYANGGGSARPMSIAINGNVQAYLQGNATGGWTTWLTENITLNLAQGVNVITLTATSSDGGPNLDLFSLQEDVIAGSCDQDCNGVLGGGAVVDLCGTCSSGNTNITPNSTCKQEPFNGTPHPIPGLIEAEDFDTGLNGLAFYETVETNQGSGTYRSEPVDIEVCTDDGGGYSLAYTSAGEWLEYTVDVQATGSYDIGIRIACNGDGRTISLEINEQNLVANIAIPNTAGWQEWQTVTITDVALTEGEQVLRLSIGDVDYININFIEFKGMVTASKSLAITETSFTPNPFTDGGITIESKGDFHYTITDISGVIVDEGNAQNSIVVGQSYKHGTYLVTITSKKGLTVKRIIKSR